MHQSIPAAPSTTQQPTPSPPPLIPRHQHFLGLGWNWHWCIQCSLHADNTCNLGKCQKVNVLLLRTVIFYTHIHWQLHVANGSLKITLKINVPGFFQNSATSSAPPVNHKIIIITKNTWIAGPREALQGNKKK